MKQNQYTSVIAWPEAGGKAGGRRREHREISWLAPPVPNITPVRLSPYTQMSSTSANPCLCQKGIALRRAWRTMAFAFSVPHHSSTAWRKNASPRYLYCVVHLPGDIAKATLDPTYWNTVHRHRYEDPKFDNYEWLKSTCRATLPRQLLTQIEKHAC